MEYELRQATPDDAEAVVRFHTLAHEQTYAHLLSDEFFAGRRASIPDRIEARKPYLDTNDPRIIAVAPDGTVVGLADAGPGRDEDGPTETELYSVYTLAHTHGSGLGAALLAESIAAEPAYLWVLENNRRAHAFYRKHGFTPDGSRKHLPASWERLPELRMVRHGVGAREESSAVPSNLPLGDEQKR